MDFNFRSQICTTREQSQRLLSLGLKKYTADMYMTPSWGGGKVIGYYAPNVVTFDDHFDENLNDLPAWSLHRLIEMMPKSIYHKNLICFLFIDQSVYVQYRIDLYGASQTRKEQFMKGNRWDNILDCIEWSIKEGYFNKEYLEG